MTACGTSPLALQLSDAALLKELIYPKKVLASSSFAGNYLYIQGNNNSLLSFDLHDPTSPLYKPLHTIQAYSYRDPTMIDFETGANVVYAVFDQSIHYYDISFAQPLEIGQYDSYLNPGSFHNIHLAGIRC